MNTLAPLLAVLAAAASAQAQDTLPLTVTVLARASQSSVITCGLFVGAKGFPDDGGVVAKVVASVAEDGTTVCVFPSAPLETIAVSVAEDINRNGKLDKTFVGYPKEPWGVSNDAPPRRFGPPLFAAAAFDAGETRRIEIKLRTP